MNPIARPEPSKEIRQQDEDPARHQEKAEKPEKAEKSEKPKAAKEKKSATIAAEPTISHFDVPGENTSATASEVVQGHVAAMRTPGGQPQLAMGQY
eukprot:Skav231480  [mRNA]  locus=scaffold1100:730141:732653:- [translate_table: standard]